MEIPDLQRQLKGHSRMLMLQRQLLLCLPSRLQLPSLKRTDTPRHVCISCVKDDSLHTSLNSKCLWRLEHRRVASALRPHFDGIGNLCNVVFFMGFVLELGRLHWQLQQSSCKKLTSLSMAAQENCSTLQMQQDVFMVHSAGVQSLLQAL